MLKSGVRVIAHLPAENRDIRGLSLPQNAYCEKHRIARIYDWETGQPIYLHEDYIKRDVYMTVRCWFTNVWSLLKLNMTEGWF